MKIYANIIKSGQVVKTSCIGTAILDDGRISASKFNALKRSAMKEFPSPKKGQYMELTTEDGKNLRVWRLPLPLSVVSYRLTHQQAQQHLSGHL